MTSAWRQRWYDQGLSPRLTHTYVYENADGEDVVRKQRFALMSLADGTWDGSKTFLVSHRELPSIRLGVDAWEPGVGPWGQGLLYQLPSVAFEASMGGVVWWCEGERDADALRDLGKIATSHYQGSAGAREDQAKVLLGCAAVNLVMDNDDVGAQIAWYHAGLLRSVGFTGVVRVWSPPDGCKDVQQLVASGGSVGGLRRVGRSWLATVIDKLGPLSVGVGPDYGAREIREALAADGWRVKKLGLGERNA